MKNLKNYSKLLLSTLIASSLFVACSEEISETTCDTPYIANTGNLKNAGQAVDLGLPSGTKWANMNVGATSESDNGVLFIWGDVTGTQILANSVSTYTDVTDQTAASDLFNMFKGADKVGAICDTTNIAKLAEPMLIDLSGIDDAHEKRDKIVSFVKDKLQNLIDNSYTELLEATLTNDEFACIIDWNGSEFVERLPLKNDATEEEKDACYEGFDYTLLTTLVIDQITTTQVDFVESPLANNYTKVTDRFDAEQRQDYNGGDIGSSIPSDPKDWAGKSFTFVPAYSIISDAKHDPATANWGSNWKMPTTAQIKELVESCTWVFEGTGYRVTGPNGNSIFLPAAGYRYGNDCYGNGNAGYYASGEITGTYHFPSMVEQMNGSMGTVSGSENMPNMLIFQHGLYDSLGIYHNLSTSFGVSIRPVQEGGRP